MAERQHISEVTQLGVETTPGTAVAANKQLLATSIMGNPNADSDSFAPAGHKFDTLVNPTQEWVEGDVEGRVAFNDLAYLLSSLLTTVTPTQIMDGGTPTGAYQWLFTPSSTAPDSPKTFTVERGSSFRAHRFAYCLLTELGFSFERDGAPEISGSVIGQRIEDGVTLTASPTPVVAVPALITGVDVFMDTTSGGLGTTKLGRLRSCEVTIGDRFNPVWVIDSTKPSFAAHVENKPSAEFSMSHEADAQGMGILTAFRAGETRFFRVQALGARIYDGTVDQFYTLQIDFAAKVNDPGDFDDDDGLEVMDWGWTIVHDGTWGKALTIKVINTLSAL